MLGSVLQRTWALLLSAQRHPSTFKALQLGKADGAFVSSFGFIIPFAYPRKVGKMLSVVSFHPTN